MGLFIGDLSFAQEAVYQPLVDLPRLDADEQSTEEYVNALYLLSITIAAFLAFVKILYGGIKWMFSDVVTSKESAKKDIRGALFGLLIVVSAVLILETINTDLTNLNIFGDAPAIIQPNIPEGEAEEVQPVDAEVGDSLTTDAAAPEEEEHFRETCPGVINNVLDGTSGETILSCDEAVDEVNALTFNCTGNTCICDPGSENQSVCVSRCRIDGPQGMTYVKYSNLSDGNIECTYIVEQPISSCQSIYYTSCINSAVGGMSCETVTNAPERVCRTTKDDASTYFYGFAE